MVAYNNYMKAFRAGRKIGFRAVQAGWKNMVKKVKSFVPKAEKPCSGRPISVWE